MSTGHVTQTLRVAPERLQQEELPVWSNIYGTNPEWSDSRITELVQKHAADR